MLLPVAPGPTLDRVEGFALWRRPFVVTMSFIGPDRRPAVHRPGTEKIKLVDVPNPIRESAKKMLAEERQSEINMTKILLNFLRLERYSVQLRWFANAMRSMFQKNEIELAKLTSFAEHIRYIVEDFPFRVQRPSSGISKILTELLNSSDAIQHKGLVAERRDILSMLGNCIVLAKMIDALLDSASCTPGTDRDSGGIFGVREMETMVGVV